jgi:hypothetical protein
MRGYKLRKYRRLMFRAFPELIRINRKKDTVAVITPGNILFGNICVIILGSTMILIILMSFFK